MKKVREKTFIIISLIALIIMITIIVGNRALFGVWNPFSLPNRIECYNRRYYISNLPPKTLTGDEKPIYSISSLNNVIGKDLYTIAPKGEFVPTVIYLKMKDDKFQSYELSGSP